MQAEFALAVLKACRKHEIHTAVDTCCYGPTETLTRLAQVTDLFLCDIKHMDSLLHEQFTGVGNELILKNISMLSDAGCAMIIRVPVVPGFNDGTEQVEAIAQFAERLKTVGEIDLLPYHSGGIAKAEKLQAADEMINDTRPSDETMSALKQAIENHGFNVKIGG